MPSIQRTAIRFGRLLFSLATLTACASAPTAVVGAAGTTFNGPPPTISNLEKAIADVRTVVQGALALQCQLGSVSAASVSKINANGAKAATPLSAADISAIRTRDSAPDRLHVHRGAGRKTPRRS